jgi:hypothetical protein
MLYKYTRVPHALCSAQAPTLIRQNLKIKCFIAEDPRELQGSCGGAGTEVPCLLEDLKTVTVGTSTFQPQRWSRKYGLEGTRRPERGTGVLRTNYVCLLPTPSSVHSAMSWCQ